MRLVSATIMVLAALVCAPSWAVEYSERSWTDDEGKSVSAKLLRLSGSTAILDQDGKIVRAPVGRLSDADQEWIKKVRELNRWREWTMIDGTKRRLKFENKEGDEVTLKEGSASVELTIDQLSDVDRQLLATVFDTATATAPGFESPMAGGTGATESREWTNSNGKKIDAEYRGVEGEKVVLFFQNREWRVPLAQFSQTDQDWVAQQNAPPSSGTPNSGNGYGAPSPPPPQVAAAPATLFEAAQHQIRGRTNPGFDSSAASPIESTPPDPMAAHNAAMERMEQNRLENERRAEEQWAAMRGQQDEMDSMASAPSTPSHSAPSPPESFSPGPSMHEPTFPASAPADPGSGGVMMNEYTCSSCNHTWHTAREMGAGDKCPKCGITFDFMEDENGKIVEETSTGKAKRYGGIVKLVIFAVMAVGGLLAKFSR
ncbi:hypothetical protein [Aeoliella sp. SH292]|uniref:hypothetical protein n=1 Tax=Aeoliella sp. SH292 TaxID=3454464 RepID=UPI003F9CDCB8